MGIIGGDWVQFKNSLDGHIYEVEDVYKCFSQYKHSEVASTYHISMTSLGRLKSPAIRMLFKQFAKANNKENIKGQHYCPFSTC